MAPRARGRAQSARVSESEGCTTQADCRPSVSGQSDARTHIGMATRPTFVHSETVRGLHARGRAHSARASESNGVVCKAGCRPSVSSYTDASTHIGMASTRPTFVHLETVRGLPARGRTHSARASDSNGVVCKAGCRPWVSGQTDARTHIGMASTRPISTIEILDWVDPFSVSPRSATHRHCRRWLSAVLPKRIGSQSLRFSEFLGSGNQEADWRMAIAIT